MAKLKPTIRMSQTALSEQKNRAEGCGRVLFGVIGFGFALIGSIIFFNTLITPMMNSRRAMSWTETACKIVDTEIEIHEGDDSSTYEPVIRYAYQVDGDAFESKSYSFKVTWGSRKSAREVLKKYPIGSEAVCFYDPAIPENAVIERDFKWNSSVMPFFMLIFITVGGAFFLMALFGWGFKSKNRDYGISGDTKAKAAAFDKAKASNGSGSAMSPFAAEANHLDQEWSIPKKLRPESTTLVAFLVVTVFALIWNGIVGVFVYNLFFEGGFEWFKIFVGLFLVPFVLVGIVTIVGSVYTFLSMFNPNVVIAISSGAVPLGGEVDIAWEVEGRPSKFRSLKIEVHGTQSATYRQGTDTHTDTEVFELLPVANVTSKDDIAFGSATVTIPMDSMHTFTGDNNKIIWRIVVHGDVPRWPDVRQFYEFRVKPV